MPWWEQVIGGNTLLNWLIAIGIVMVSWIVVRIVRVVLFKRFKDYSSRTRSTLDDFIVHLTEGALLPALYLGSLYAGITYLTLSPKVNKILHVVVLVVITFIIIKTITSALNYLINNALGNDAEDVEKKRQARGIILIINIVLWIIGLVFLINNLGYNITSVVTGLGIGGVAIALASQAILGDLFNYFVIFFDKPFEVGDFIIVDDKMGSIEYIGVKSTRIRTLSGEQLICSNTNLVNARIHNYKRMEKRRVVFTFNIVYNTSPDKVAKIPGMVKEIIQLQETTLFDRAHFSAFGQFSLTFEVVYYVLSADYNLYMDRQQAIYLAILNAFKKENISFALPTQTLLFNDGPFSTQKPQTLTSNS
ncbi:MscS Mechanosensitive ion channel [Niastella koreensis GR20-10]|uniref:MscS Mechanosensitive ion channel n=2 Tax=Niastella koreensis TaxID=354356 RepID=G8T7S9_NIAKG|nr:mechanosensitive ion channel family protein [Niastella koreensis]AEW03373.1 MscS Mechanosensitive ion channel [Niastella koreensis GR20-10]